MRSSASMVIPVDRGVSPTSSLSTTSPPSSPESIAFSSSGEHSSEHAGSNVSGVRDRVFSPDNLPFHLKQLKRSPKVILEKKFKSPGAEEAKNFKMLNANAIAASKPIEESIKMRLYYLGIIKNLENINMKNNISPTILPQRKTIKRRKTELMFELDKLRGQLHEQEERMSNLTHHLNNLTMELNCLQSLSKEEESKHKESLCKYQAAMARVLAETDKFPASARATDSCYGTPPGSFTKQVSGSGGSMNGSLTSSLSFSPSISSSMAFTPPSRELSFSGTLMPLVGQLAEFSQGRHGSNHIIKRINVGSEMERDLVWSELKLPSSLLSIIISENPNSLAVVLALSKASDDLCTMLLDHAHKNEKTIGVINGGSDFVDKLSRSLSTFN